MSEELTDAAFLAARESYEAAMNAVYHALEERYPGSGFATLRRAIERGTRLHLATITLSRKLWAKKISFEDAEATLARRFPEFSASARRRALEEAFRRPR